MAGPNEPGLRALATVVLAVFAIASPAAQRPERITDLRAVLARIGERVERYYDRAETLIATETVRIQPIGSDMMALGRARRVVNELRVAWGRADSPGADADANVLRQVLTVDGRPPRPDDEPACLDPLPVSPEPLAILLPERQAGYTFSYAGTARTDGRQAVRLDYRAVAAGPDEVEWREDCAIVSLPGKTGGRIWIDTETGDVLRLDEHLMGQFEFRVPHEKSSRGAASWMVVERADSTIRYKPVIFRDPDETLMLPASIETFTVIRGAGTPRLRTVQTLSRYRRFLTGGRIVPVP